jgi:pyridinium-3,5-biscarboxylic acid mononucleotide sulfurtransferase
VGSDLADTAQADSAGTDPAGTDPAGAALLGWFGRCASVRVAFSGGVDSSLVLAAATRALGPASVEAVTAVSESLPSGMLTAARQLAAALGVSHTELVTRELDNPGYVANGADRCYFCKATLIDTVTRLGDGVPLVTGTNADDVRAGWRPGIRAAAERGVGTPLADTGMTKAAVRALSHEWGLPTWDRPASPCLSSRIAYGVQITPTRLARVDAAEQAVRGVLGQAGLKVHDLRVRDLGDTVRLEVDPPAVTAVRELVALVPAIAAAGFGAAAIEVTPFRSGSLNDALPGDQRFR